MQIVGKLLLILLLAAPLFSSGCREQQPETEKQPYLLIYSGFTMGRAVRELANRFELKENLPGQDHPVFSDFGLGR